MYNIDLNQNKLIKIIPKTFSELGFKERTHLQEWLDNTPEALGEELLIIQKEFAGFDETRERLDLLALDKQGNLVVIENKLDDSGKDVTWQALKYASYVSSLKKRQVKDIYQKYLDAKRLNENAEENISDFLEGIDFNDVKLNQNQRIILVAAKFRKEVTSTIMWLLTKCDFKIQCFKATPYEFQNNYFLDIEQILPVKEVEEFTIKMSEKLKEDQHIQENLMDRQKIRYKFWSKLLDYINQKSDLYANVTPNKETWLSTGAGISGVNFSFIVSNTKNRVEIYMERYNKDENKFIFDRLYEKKEQIEAITGPLIWQRLNDKKASRIKKEVESPIIYENKEDWPHIIEPLVDEMLKFEKAFKKPLQEIGKELKKLHSKN